MNLAPVDIASAAIVIVVLLAVFVPLNLWNSRRRAAMSPAERTSEDVEDGREATIW